MLCTFIQEYCSCHEGKGMSLLLNICLVALSMQQTSSKNWNGKEKLKEI